MLDVGRRNAVPTRALEAFEDFGNYRMLELSRLNFIARVERALDSPLMEYLLKIGRNWNADYQRSPLRRLPRRRLR